MSRVKNVIFTTFLVLAIPFIGVIHAVDNEEISNETTEKQPISPTQNSSKEQLPSVNPSDSQTPVKSTTSTAKSPISNHLNSPSIAEGMLEAGIAASKIGDYANAFKLFAKSCDDGNPAGCFAVGTMYMNGVGIQTDIQKAARYYEMGCSGGDAAACTSLAMIYDSEKKSNLEDKEKAVQLYMTACQGGDGQACNNLAWMYANGDGIQKDYFKAIQYYQFACGIGSELGCYNLGLMSNTNNIYGPNKARLDVVDLNYMACNAGDINGCANLGWLYASGTSGAPINYFSASQYFQTACDGGVLSSCNNLGVLYQKGLGVPQDTRKALDLFAQVCNSGVQSGCDNYRIFKEQILHPPKKNTGSFFLPRDPR